MAIRRRQASFIVYLLFVVLSFFQLTFGQEDYSTWSHSAIIRLNTKSSGVPITSVMRGFPLLIRLNNDNFPFFDIAQSGGADIRIANSAGKPLPYEIERWVNNSGMLDTAEIWVLPDSIVPADSLQHLRLYWGKKNAADSSNSKRVFTGDNGFSGVYHLSEDDKPGASGGAGYYKDAVGSHHGHDSIVSNSDNSGYIGKGHKFGPRDAIPVGAWKPSDTRITVSAWVKWSGDSSGFQSIVSKRSSLTDVNWELNYSPDITPKGISVYNGSVQQGFGKSMVSPNVWHHIALASWNDQDNGTTLYVDGVAVGTNRLAWGSGFNAPIFIGNAVNYRSGSTGADSGGSYWKGVLDEVRIEKLAHGSDWIKLCYENQRATGQKLLSMHTKPIITAEPNNVLSDSVTTATFTIGVYGPKIKYQWYQSIDGKTWTIPTERSDTLLLRVAASTSDSSIQYRCIVTNDFGRDTSVAALLLPCAGIAFARQPSNILGCKIGTVVTFIVSVTETFYTYKWEHGSDGVVWSDIAGATGSRCSLTVSDTTKAGKYRCKVMSLCDTAYSNVANLSVCSPIVIVKKPTNQSVIEGVKATFTIGTNGNARMYQWYSKKSGSGWSALSGAVDSSYTLLSASGDEGTLFRCVVTASCDTVSSDSVRLTVYKKVRASYSVKDSVGQAPMVVKCTDASTGDISRWKWVFGDGSTDTGSSSTSPSHTYQKAGLFTITLVVSGPGGVDSVSKPIRVLSPQGNPVVVSGKRLSSTSVLLTYANIDAVNISKTVLPYAQKVRLLCNAGSIPNDTLSPVKIIKTYDAADFTGHGNTYSDTVTLDDFSSEDSLYGFITQIVWNDGMVTTLQASNGCEVNMNSRDAPVNRLVVKGVYLPWDTVYITIDSTATIDWDEIDSVVFWYGIGSDSVPQFTNTLQMKKWDRKEFEGGVTSGRFTWRVVDEMFNTDRTDLNCAVMLIGKNGRTSTLVTSFFSVGRSRPDNNVTLQARARNANTIELSWNKQSGIDKLRIFYRTGEPLPFDYQFTGVESINAGVDTVSYTLTLLNQKTRYYFAAQIFTDGMWSKVTSASSASDSTPAAIAATIENSIKILGASFDSLSEQFIIDWTISSDAGDNLQIGASYTTKTNTAGDSVIFRIFDVEKSTGTIELGFNEAIEFETDYTLMLRLRKSNENWTEVTSASKKVVYVGAFGVQTIEYVLQSRSDTTSWVNSTIQIITPALAAKQPATIEGKLLSFTPDKKSLKGFINVGNGFALSGQTQSERLTIGMKCSTIPKPYTVGDVRIYRYDGKNFLLEPKTEVDTAAAFVLLQPDEMYRPFVALIDTLPPVVTRIGRRDTLITAGTDCYDSLRIEDNVANASWYYYAATTGNRDQKLGYTSNVTTASSCSDTVVILSPKKYATEAGVKTIATLFDGRSGTSITLSRRVRLDKCNPVQTVPERWTPLKITAALETSDADVLLRTMLRGTGTTIGEKFDIRLFRWYPDGTNDDSDDKWIEYGNSTKDIFEFTSGKLFWVKTYYKLNLNFGKGMSMSPTDSVVVHCPPGNWTDFANPFHFDVTVGEVLAASRLHSSGSDSLQFYQWSSDQKTGRYSAQAFYLPGIKGSDVDDESRVMGFDMKTGFTVWNPTSDTVSLVFSPVLPKADTVKKEVAKLASSSDWVVKVHAELADGHSLSPLFCGYSKAAGATYYPQPPSMESVQVGILGKSEKVSAHMIYNKIENGGFSYLLRFRSTAQESQTIRCTLQPLGSIDPEAKVVLYDVRKGLKNDADSTGAVTITVEAGATAYQQLLVGNSAFIDGFTNTLTQRHFTLTKIGPNPVRSLVTVHFTLPAIPIRHVEITIMDILGRTVWHSTDATPAGAGASRSFCWNATNNNGSRISSGIYILKVVAFNDEGAPAGSFDHMLTVIP